MGLPSKIHLLLSFVVGFTVKEKLHGNYVLPGIT